MSVKVMIPTALRRFTNNQAELHIDGQSTVGGVMGQVVAAHGELKTHLFDDSGSLRSFVNLYVNNEDVRYLQKDATPVNAGDVLMIVPSIAGGR